MVKIKLLLIKLEGAALWSLRQPRALKIPNLERQPDSKGMEKNSQQKPRSELNSRQELTRKNRKLSNLFIKSIKEEWTQHNPSLIHRHSFLVAHLDNLISPINFLWIM